MSSPASDAGFCNLVEMFHQSCRRYAGNPLFGVKRDGRYQWLTYREVEARVDRCRAGLADLGVGKGDKVAIIANNSPEWAITAYATYGLGAQYVPMYEAQLAKDWKYILEDSGAGVLIVSTPAIYEQTKGFAGTVGALAQVVCLGLPASDPASFEALEERGRARPVEPVHPEPEDVCGFIYTSGTTGNPKGVLLTHRNLASNVNALHETFPMSPEDCSLSFLPWAHSFGQTCELHGLISYGASTGLAESVESIIPNLAELRPTLLFSVPRIFNRIYDGVHKKMAEEGGTKKLLFDRTLAVANRRRTLLEDGGRTSFLLELQYLLLDALVGRKIRGRFGGRLRYAFSGGAALSPEVATFIDNLGIMVYEGYGLTETSPIVTANCPAARRIGSVGRPVPGVRVAMVPCEGAPEGHGEIVVYGPNVMRGYHNLPEQTADVMTADGGFRTGDLGRVDEAGFVWITGRVKEHFKLENGKYVAPAPLEEQLKLSPYIANLMIDGTNRPCNAAIVAPDYAALRSWAREHQRSLAAEDNQALCDDPEVQRLIGEEIARHSASFKGFERVQKFVLVPEDFTTQNDMLTPTLKIKRRTILARWGDRLAALYR
jgi:long-chain acyl-CoA synthetase